MYRLASPYASRGFVSPGMGVYAPGLSLRGLGFTEGDLVASLNLPSCDPRDSACVASNQQATSAVEDLWVNKYESNPATALAPTPSISVQTDTSPAAMAAFFANQPANEATISQGGSTYTVPQLEAGPVGLMTTGTPAPVSLAPSFKFSPSRPGTSFQVGDTWTITVTGTPGQSVYASGSQNGGPYTTTTMGTINSGGQWSTSGSFDPSTVGSWAERWLVGSAPVGNINFTVSPAAPAAAPPAAGGPASPPVQAPLAAGAPALSTGVTVPPSSLPYGWLSALEGARLFGFPAWVVVAGGIGLLFLFGGKHGR